MLKKTQRLILAAALALAPAHAALAKYAQYCLQNNGAYSAGFRIEIVKRGVSPDGPGEPIDKNYLFLDRDWPIIAGKTGCASDRQTSIMPGDAIRIYVDPFFDINNVGTRECGKNDSQTHQHENLFLIPDGPPRGKFVIKSWGSLYNPSCAVISGERMHSACAAEEDGMDNAGCNRWELDQNPASDNVSLSQAVRDDDGVGRLADLVARAGYDIDQSGADGDSALHAAAETGRLNYMDFIISRGANLNARNDTGVTPVLKAIRPMEHGDASALQALLSAGASPNLASYDGEFPLHLAATHGELEMVRLLTEAGAHTDALHAQTGKTALDVARENGRGDIVQFLRSLNAAERLYPPEQELLNIVATDQGAQWLRAATENGADLNASDGDGITALHLAAVENRADYAAELLELGADPDRLDGRLRSPLMAAMEAEPYYPAAIQALLQGGANPDLQNGDGDFPLHLAAELGREDMTAMLVITRPDLNINQRHRTTGQTALGLADELFERSGRPEHAKIRQFLLANGAVR